MSISTVTIAPDSYILRLFKFRINNTRAVDEDTDHVAFAFKLGNNPSQDPQTQTLHTGDVDNGEHLINLTFGPTPIDGNTPVNVNFQIVNSGHENQNDIEQAFINAASTLSKASVASGSIWGAAAAGAIELLKAIFDLNCDGAVAVDSISLTGQDLANLTAVDHGVHNDTRHYIGLDSKGGCGSNSDYTVTWSVIRVPLAVPTLDGIIHLQGIADVSFRDNQFAGTLGQSRRLEGFQVSFLPVVPGLSMQYMAHLQGIGDVPFVQEGQFVGTRGQSRRLEGFAVELTGPLANSFDIVYQAHLQDTGETPFFKNGEFCGTRGESRRVEAIFLRLERRTGPPPPFVS